jgi:hypothetical protein
VAQNIGQSYAIWSLLNLILDGLWTADADADQPCMVGQCMLKKSSFTNERLPSISIQLIGNWAIGNSLFSDGYIFLLFQKLSLFSE